MDLDNALALSMHIKSKTETMNEKQRRWFSSKLRELDLKVTYNFETKKFAIDTDIIDLLAEQALLK